jgi:hypothetical protein
MASNFLRGSARPIKPEEGMIILEDSTNKWLKYEKGQWIDLIDHNTLEEITNLQSQIDNFSSAPAVVPSHARYVDKINGDDNYNGSATQPFKTIQAAIDDIGIVVDGTDEKVPRSIFIYGGAYDEDLVIPSAGMWSLVALGHVTLGDASLQYLSSSVPRNITWNVDQALEFSQARPTLFLTQGYSGFYNGSTHVAYGSTGWDITGDITLTQSSFTSTELYLSGVKVRGEVDASAKPSTLTVMLERCYIAGQFIGGSATRIDYARDCEFDGLVTATNLGKIVECEIASITYTSFATTLLKPVGFFGCQIEGTITTGANQYRADGTTQVLSAAATLAGATTLFNLQ